MMVDRIIPRIPAGLLMLLGSAALARAQFGGFGGAGNDNGDGNPFSSSNSNGFGGQGDFDPNQTMAIHGVLAAIAMVLLFPIGSILVRVLPGRMALWGHVLGQILALVVFIGAAAQGMRLAHQIQIPGQTNFFLTNSSVNYHPIIGIVVLIALLIQPLLGFIHHARFKRLRRRQAWSHLHMWNGRVFVTLGIVNGGLGLKIANASTGLKVAYAVVAAIMWVLWMLAALFGEVRLRRANGPARKAGPPGYTPPEYAPPGYAPPGYREVATGPKPEERSGPRYG